MMDTAAPDGYRDEGDRIYSRQEETGIVFVLGDVVELDGEVRLSVHVAGFPRATRAEAMMDLADQLREIAGGLEARAFSEQTPG